MVSAAKVSGTEGGGRGTGNWGDRCWRMCAGDCRSSGVQALLWQRRGGSRISSPASLLTGTDAMPSANLKRGASEDYSRRRGKLPVPDVSAPARLGDQYRGQADGRLYIWLLVCGCSRVSFIPPALLCLSRSSYPEKVIATNPSGLRESARPRLVS